MSPVVLDAAEPKPPLTTVILGDSNSVKVFGPGANQSLRWDHQLTALRGDAYLNVSTSSAPITRCIPDLYFMPGALVDQKDMFRYMYGAFGFSSIMYVLGGTDIKNNITGAMILPALQELVDFTKGLHRGGDKIKNIFISPIWANQLEQLVIDSGVREAFQTIADQNQDTYCINGLSLVPNDPIYFDDVHMVNAGHTHFATNLNNELNALNL